MTLELDHLFICSQVNAPEMQHLLELGLVEGRSNHHPGQGTANRCVFFQNFMLELLFVVDEVEVSSPTIAPTHLWERWQYQQTGYSPWGIALSSSNADASWAFHTWPFRPPYLPPHLQIDIAQDTQPEEPLLFVVPFKPRNTAKAINHPAGMKQVTSISITIPKVHSISPAMQQMESLGLVQFILGTEHLVTIEFDHAASRSSDQAEPKTKDLRPHLPLRIIW